MTKLLDQSCKNIQKPPSDGWSSEEDDDVFDATGQEMTSPQTGVLSSAFVLMCHSSNRTNHDEYKQHSSFLSSGPPIVSEEELASLPLICPAKTSQYSGSRVKALIQILQHQMDQQELIKEFMVCMSVFTMTNQFMSFKGNTYNILNTGVLSFSRFVYCNLSFSVGFCFDS